ncbi:MAG: M23 family metallopeptidase [Flavobacteriales bacterium]|nr:M23 family metallopeptidase [Flavobacteriales bacterium]
MRIPLSIAILFCFIGESRAQNKLANQETRFNIFSDGKLPYSAEKPVESWNINDSLALIPAYDLYCEWNTERIHPYKEDLRNMKDTVPLVLVYDSCDFVPPYVGRKSSDFGYRRYRYHYGVDVKLYRGEQVKAAFEGVVRIAQYDGDYGRVVVLRHENGLETLYAHLSKLKVKEGDKVEAGDLVGLGGNTGRSTGSHLHFEIRYKGEPINPNTIIEWETGYLCQDTLMLNKEHFQYLIEVRKRKYHKIRSGDTLSGIARRYGTSVRNLCRLNGIRSTTTLRIGRTLRYN